MNIHLSLFEQRVIGALIEKEITTPEQYPLSLNALTNACNQKSNRDPVLQMDKATVQETLDSLIKKYMVSDKVGFGSRVTKYQHRFCNSEFGLLKFSPQELAIICELLLRGPQTPGELRSNASRMCKYTDVQEVEATLKNLTDRQDGPFVKKLAREPGKRESRYTHLFVDDSADLSASYSSRGTNQPQTSQEERITRLESLVDQLREEISQLKQQIDSINPER